MIAFGNYKYLVYILSVSAIVLALYVFYCLWKRRALSAMSSGLPRGSFIIGSARVALTREILVSAAVVLFAFLMLRPQWGERMREVRNEGSDVLIALDVSPSMLARDIKPSRLDRAKAAVRWIVESLKGDRIGLVLFSGDAFLQCPLTNDYGAFMMFLDSAGPDSISLKGTSIGAALNEAYRVFEKKRITSKILVLITDGEDHEGAADEAVAKFRAMDVSVYALGVGRESGEVIPTEGDDREGDSYYRDSEGNLVKTRKNPDLLKRLAALTRGSYFDISSGFSGLHFILEIIEDQQRNEYGSRIIKEPREQYEIFALILILILSLELMLPERRYRKGESHVRKISLAAPLRKLLALRQKAK